MKSENAEIFYERVKRVSPQLENDLDVIKQRFSTEVNSKRRLSVITSFEDLVKVLVKRSFINPAADESISWLNRICQLYSKKEPAMPAYQQHLLQQVPQHSQQSWTGVENHRTCVSNSNQAASASSRVQGPTLPPQIVEHLSRNITKRFSWKCLARELGVKEGDISLLEKKHPEDDNACLREVLQLYIQEMPAPNQISILTKLEEALDAIKRQKLCKEVREIARSLNSSPAM